MYILDSSAILRYLDGEPGAVRVSEIIKSHLAGRCEAMISALHWGEVAGVTHKVHGRQGMDLGIELAADSAEHVFVTADFDFKPASRDVAIEFLPAK